MMFLRRKWEPHYDTVLKVNKFGVSKNRVDYEVAFFVHTKTSDLDSSPKSRVNEVAPISFIRITTSMSMMDSFRSN